MDISPMSLAELDEVLGWAAAEGWNPGRDDATAFLDADPDGFLVGRLDGAPVAAISVVNHSPEVAFLGLYLCRPEFRGRGLGLAVWNAGLAHAGHRAVLLDGVPAQQANYLRSGFAPLGRTIRFRGSQAAPPRQRPTERPRPLVEADLPALIAADARVQGYARPAYIGPWFSGAPSRRTLVFGPAGAPTAWATGRMCREGIKIGPLFARTQAHAVGLLAALSSGVTCMIDVPEHSTALAETLRARGFGPIFDTARMVRGTAPRTDPPPFEAVATLELG